MTKTEIGEVLGEIALLLELKGENPFKVRAYQTGARVLESLEEGELASLVREKGLQSGQGDRRGSGGEDHAAARDREARVLRQAQGPRWKPGLLEMLQIPGLEAEEDQGAP